MLHYRAICLKWGKCELGDSASRTNYVRVMIIKAGLRGIRLMLLPTRACVSFGLTPTWVIAQSFVWEYINWI